MERFVFIVSLFLSLSTGIQAQVKIGGTNGTPNSNAMLDVESVDKGFLLPRVALDSTLLPVPLAANVEGMLVYNTESTHDVTPGLYQNDGTKWVKLVSEGMATMPKFFYMPSIVFNTSTIGTEFKRNLYAEYKAQFTNKEFLPDAVTGGSIGTAVRPTFVKSINAPNEIPNLPVATDLYYYVTDYDNTALANLSIDANGVLTYDVVGTGTDYSFVNIVFVVK
ncbi:hypothetical protein FAZ19_08760 [Sphingobacterium alkalisoli]|uniref:Uncharacterized protein n=1 Tax=Sphingobacterium alkalisoli TaxID=1874115 RepID=A0A4U0H5Q6_9SPHI|nr:hypothetical protein [Sphingobacterium alkalisoli]TJY66978.1 hypothetical protein FAZ19_08760 [Sphingobacterium alkalisoli]GGH13014.1 hypothetical protein GCM10011418_12930 [Sphingobacterium alkalisoli]